MLRRYSGMARFALALALALAPVGDAGALTQGQRAAATAAVSTNACPSNAPAQAFFARVPVMTRTWQSVYCTLIATAVSSGAWAQLDVLDIPFAPNSATALTNLVSASFAPTVVNPSLMGFTTGIGFTPDGATSYLNSNYTPSTAGGKFTQNSAHVSLFDLSNRLTANGGMEIGSYGSNGSWLEINANLTSTGQATRLNNSGTYYTANANPTQTKGFYLADRSSSTLESAFFNNAAIGTTSGASSAPPNNPVFVGAQNNNTGSPTAFSSDTIAAYSIGGSLTPTQQTALYNAITTAFNTVQSSVLSNGLGQVPQMGWDSWRAYGMSATEALIKANVNAMASNGMLAAGYTYVIPDGNWTASRSGGTLVTNTTLYPDGMASLNAYIHSMGFKAGMYLSPSPGPGNTGCASFPGSGGYEAADAALVASYGADYVKYDNCYNFTSEAAHETAYAAMGAAIRATGRPMMYQVSDLGNDAKSPIWARGAGGNEVCTYVDYGNMTWAILGTQVDAQYGYELYAIPGRFNDNDFLGVGNGTLTDTEGQSNFSLWAILASPLYASIDLTSASANTLATLTNSEVIAVDQDPLGIQGKRVSRVACGSANCEVYARQLSSGKWSIVMWNRSSTSQSITANWSMFGQSGPFTGRDLWAHGSVGSLPSGYTTTVASHGVSMLLLSP